MDPPLERILFVLLLRGNSGGVNQGMGTGMTELTDMTALS